MPDQVIGQGTPQDEARAGAGTGADVNPWAAYGLNPDGTPIVVEEKKPVTDDKTGDPNTAALQAKVAELEAKLAKLPESFEGMTKKMQLVDRLVAALKGDDAPAGDPKVMREVYGDLKRVAKASAPGLAKMLDLLEENPDWIDQVAGSQSALMANHLIGLNERAHERVLTLAKKAGFKAANTDEMSALIFPFEQTMTTMINANAELRKAFISGNIEVVDEIFTRLVKPHVAIRLREKQSRAGAPALPKAAPSGGAPGTGEDKPKRDLSTPAGKAAFHKQAVGRWLDKAAQQGAE